MTLAATAALLFVAGYGYLFLLGAAASIVLLPRRWQPLAVVAAPHLGWAALVAIGYPFNAALPFRVVALLLAGAALLVILVGPTPLAPLPAREGGTMAGVVAFRRAFRARAVAIVRRQPWREAGAPFLIGALTYAVAVAVHVRQGALSALVADSDVEHFADVVAALLHFPIGWSVGAQQGLEATPVGLAYHYVHAALSAITGLDTFSTALPSNFLLLALAVQAVYVFARSVLGLRPNLATLATGLYALGGLPLIVASFGWGQQTAALAAVPFGLAALHLGITGRDGRSLWCAGLAGSLAAGSLYLATAPLVGASAIAMALVSASREHWPVRRAPLPSERIDHDARAPLRSNRTPVPPESAAATLVASPALVVLGHGVDHTAPHIAAAAPVASPTLGRPAGGAPALPDRLRQMSAHAQMYPAALAAWTSPLVRLVRIGVIVAAAGALSHLSAAAFLLERASVGLLRADELTGRSTHVSTFVGPAEAFGVAPLELFRDVTTVGGEPLLVWSVTTATTLASMAAAAPLFVAGLIWSARTRPHLLSVLAVMTAYEVYLRWLRPFPYGEFKLLSSVWFVAPCLVAAGAGFVADRSSRWLDARPPAAQRRLATGIVSSVVSGAAGRPGTGPSPRGIAWLAAALFGAWLLLTHLHAIRFLSLPWGGVLPETAMADARAIVRAVPVGASVYVSGQLTPPVAYSTAWELTLHRAGFPSASARADYLGKRWRGVLTSLLAFGGRPVYGLARRHSAELRAPIRPEDAAYLLLDGTEDPRLYGDLPADLVASAGSLRLYRQAHRLFASAQDLRRPPLAIQGGSQVDTGAGVSAETEGDAADGGAGDRGAGDEGAWQLLLHLRIGGDGLFVVDGGQERAIAPHPGALPAPMMPVGESLPGRRGNLTTFPSLDLTPWPPLRAGEGERWPPGATAAAGTATGHLVIGLQAVAPAHVIITAREASGSAQPRALALMPGLTWYTTTELRWPAEVNVDVESSPEANGGATVRPVGVIVVPARQAGHPVLAESLERSAAGVAWPLLTVTADVSPAGDTLTLDAWYSYLGPREGTSQLRLRSSPELWIGGDAFATNLHLGPGGRVWQVAFTPRSAPQQWVSDGRAPALAPAAWAPEAGRRWLWGEVGPHRQAALHEPALVQLDIIAGRVQIVETATPAVVLPLVGESVPQVRVEDGTLVKGSGDDVFYVDHGRLRWVPSIESLERHGIPWRLTVLDDYALWRLPVDLPLT